MVTLLECYEKILEQVTENKEIKIEQVELMDREESININTSLQKDKDGIAIDFDI